MGYEQYGNISDICQFNTQPTQSKRLICRSLEVSSSAPVGIEALARQFKDYFEPFKKMFITRTRDNRETASHYLCGLLQGEKRNLERMEEAVPESNYQGLQHFITDSPWDDREVMDEVARKAHALLASSNARLIPMDSISSKNLRIAISFSSQNTRPLML